MISKEEVLHLAKLARLELSHKEIEIIQKNLSGVLDYFAVLKNAKKEKQEELSSDKKNILRQDKPETKRGYIDDIMRQTKELKDGYIKVKSIL